MGIKFRCQSCDKKLHVKAFLAGKRGVCPYCGAKVRIPKVSPAGTSSAPAGENPNESRSVVESEELAGDSAEQHKATRPKVIEPSRASAAHKSSSRTSTRSAAATSSGGPSRAAADPIAEAPEAVWYVRPPSGGQYGPADAEIMRRWLEEGRVGADSLVWREGWPDWKNAASVFPVLQHSTTQLEDALPVAAGGAAAEDAFAVVDKRSVTRTAHARTSGRALGRNVAIIVALSLVCIGLLVALFFVLRSQG